MPSRLSSSDLPGVKVVEWSFQVFRARLTLTVNSDTIGWKTTNTLVYPCKTRMDTNVSYGATISLTSSEIESPEDCQEFEKRNEDTFLVLMKCLIVV